MRDRDVRKALYAQVLIEHRGDPNTLIVEELGICGISRVDVAVVNGVLHGYEIKSDSDTLDRLPSQAKVYSAVFDFVTIVAGRRHSGRLLALIPRWWGVIEAEDSDSGVCLSCVRRPLKNPSVDPLSLARLLWRDEVLATLEDNDAAYGFRSKTRERLCERLVNVLGPERLGQVVRHRIRSRADWRSDSQRTLGGGSCPLVAK